MVGDPRLRRYQHYVRVRNGTCAQLKRSFLRDRVFIDVFIKNVGSLDNPVHPGTFVLVHATSLLRFNKQKFELVFYRNPDTATRQVVWSVQTSDGKIEPARDYRREVPAEAARGFRSVDSRTEFERLYPGFLAHLGGRDRAEVVDGYDLWPYIVSARPLSSDIDAWTVSDYQIREMVSALAFDISHGPGSSDATPRLQIIASGPCIYINVQGPAEELRRRAVLEFADEGIACVDLK